MVADYPTDLPDDWEGSIPEYFVMWALFKLGYKDRFDYQKPFGGGRLQKGGTVIDFYLPELNLVIMVQSVRYHYTQIEQRIADNLIRAMLLSSGYRVVYIDEEDALSNPIFYVQEALKGIDMSRMAGR